MGSLCGVRAAIASAVIDAMCSALPSFSYYCSWKEGRGARGSCSVVGFRLFRRCKALAVC